MYNKSVKVPRKKTKKWWFFFYEGHSIESTSKCKLPAKLVIMFEKDLIWREEF